MRVRTKIGTGLILLSFLVFVYLIPAGYLWEHPLDLSGIVFALISGPVVAVIGGGMISFELICNISSRKKANIVAIAGPSGALLPFTIYLKVIGSSIISTIFIAQVILAIIVGIVVRWLASPYDKIEG
jgi:hypothetical protein